MERVARATPTLAKLHIAQGYLGRARAMLDRLAASGTSPAVLSDLEARWGAAADAARRQARINALRKLLVAVRKVRAGARGGSPWAR